MTHITMNTQLLKDWRKAQKRIGNNPESIILEGVGISYSYWNDIIYGKTVPGAPTRKLLSMVTKIKESELFPIVEEYAA